MLPVKQVTMQKSLKEASHPYSSRKTPKERWTSKCETRHTPFITTQNHHYNSDELVLRADEKSYTIKSISILER